jgi:hypothetical protein
MKKLLLTATGALALVSLSHAAVVISWDETAATSPSEIRNSTADASNLWSSGLSVTSDIGSLVGTNGVGFQHGNSAAGSAYSQGKTITLGGYDFDGDDIADTVTMFYSLAPVGGTIDFDTAGHGVAGNTINQNTEGFNFGVASTVMTVVLSDSANFTATNFNFDGFSGIETNAGSGETYSLGTAWGNTSFGTGHTGDTSFDLTQAFGLTHEAGTLRVQDVGYQFSFDVVAVPEPSTYALLAGLTGLTYVMVRRRR